jgi:hypothetical protein
MSALQQHWVSTGYMSATDGDVEIGQCVMFNAAGTRLVPATSANQTASGRSACAGLALSPRGEEEVDRSITMQTVGPCPNEITDLGSGANDCPIIVGDDGFLERKASPDVGDIVVGKCDADGIAYLNFSTQGAQGPPGDDVLVDAEDGEILIADAGTAVGLPLGDEGQVVGIVGGVNDYRDVAEVDAGTVGHMAGYATVDGDLEDIGVVPSVTAGTNVTVDVLANNVYRVNATGGGGGGAYAEFDFTTTDETPEEVYELDTGDLEDGTYDLKIRIIGDVGGSGGDEAHFVIEKRVHFMVRTGAAVSISAATLIYADSMPTDYEPVTLDFTIDIDTGNIVVEFTGEADTTIDGTGEVMLGIGLAISPGTGWGGGGAFDPSALPEASADWAVGFFAEDAALSGSDVTSVNDSLGAGNDATVPGGSEPTYDATNSDFNNQPTIHFPAADTKRLNIPTLGIGSGPYTIVAVVKWDGAAGYLCSTNDANDAATVRKTSGDIQAADQELPTFGVVSETCPAGATVVIFVANGNTSKLYVNSDTSTNGDGGDAADLTGNTHMIGNYSNAVNGAFSLNGDIAFFGILDDEISQTDAEFLNAGFGAKYGITIT